MRQPLALALMLALAVPAAASGSKAGSRLEGRVLGPNGKPLRGAVVSVRSLDGEAEGKSDPTDSRGRFHLGGLRYGWADVIVTTAAGEFPGDQAINLPPGTKVEVSFGLIGRADRPASWWTDRRVEPPPGTSADRITGMAETSQRLTGVEYLKSPGGIAILVSVTAVTLGLIAAGGGRHKTSSNP